VRLMLQLQAQPHGFANAHPIGRVGHQFGADLFGLHNRARDLRRKRF
jgi:hypothetical protein